MPPIPVRVTAEARVGTGRFGTTLRPAAYAVTELRPIELPMRTRGEVYVQGGYVGGENATAFVDGHARIERALGKQDKPGLLAGVAAWGGAQKGASRLDIGPTAALTFPIGKTRARLSADYRFRIAGEAEPKSGPALTLSAGF